MIPNPNKEFDIIVHNNGEESIFKVKSYDSIFSLLDKLGNLNQTSISKLVYNNLVLCCSFSFAFYEIGEGAHIYAVTQQQKKQKESENTKTRQISGNIFPFLNKEQFRNAFERNYGRYYNTDEFDNYYHCLKKQSLLSEVSKLKDQFYQKIEGTMRCHRKMINNFFKYK